MFTIKTKTQKTVVRRVKQFDVRSEDLNDDILTIYGELQHEHLENQIQLFTSMGYRVCVDRKGQGQQTFQPKLLTQPNRIMLTERSLNDEYSNYSYVHLAHQVCRHVLGIIPLIANITFASYPNVLRKSKILKSEFAITDVQLVVDALEGHDIDELARKHNIKRADVINKVIEIVTVKGRQTYG